MDTAARLLVAEDSATQAVQIQAFLEDAGYEVDVVNNGRLALERVREAPPHLVVTDLEMPEMNGLELVEALQQEHPQLPVVLITARGSEEIASQALKQGAASYVPKTRIESDLIPTLARILAVVQAGLSHQRLNTCITSTETEFQLLNDNSMVPLMIARLQDDLKQLDLCSEGQLMQVTMALDEAFANAMIHGNLEVSSELRDEDDGQPYTALIKKRRSEPPYCERRVFVKLSATREEAMISIRDEGPGFDVAAVADPTDPANLDKVSGRGLLLINAFMDDVSHNETGNEIRLVKRRAAAKD